MLSKSRVLLRKGSGETVAVYSSGPDETYVQAELLFLAAKAEEVKSDPTVIGFYDVVRDTTVTQWLKAYDGRSDDFQKLLTWRARVSESGFENLIPKEVA